MLSEAQITAPLTREVVDLSKMVVLDPDSEQLRDVFDGKLLEMLQGRFCRGRILSASSLREQVLRRILGQIHSGWRFGPWLIS